VALVIAFPLFAGDTAGSVAQRMGKAACWQAVAATLRRNRV